jgi:hypothetical protein
LACVLITGGRAPVSLELARLLRGQGHRVLVAESQVSQISRRSRAVEQTFIVPPPRQQPQAYRQALLEIIEREHVDVLLPTCEEVFHIAAGDWPEKLLVWTDRIEKLRRLHSKWTFNQEARALGLSTPRSHQISSPRELEQFRELAGRWIVKPTFSRFGHNVHMGTVAELCAIDLDFSNGQSWVLQEFLDGPEYCVYALVYRGRMLGLSIYAHEFVAGKAGICFEEISCPAIENFLPGYLKALDYTGQIAFDFIIQDGVAYALECNPRATSGVHLLATVPAFAQALIAPQEQRFVRAQIGSQAKVGIAMFLFGLRQVRSFARLVKWWRILFSAREVVFSWRDPVPFFDQFLCVFELAWQARRSQLDLLSASTADIEWNGE